MRIPAVPPLAVLVALLTASCARPPSTPMPDPARPCDGRLEALEAPFLARPLRFLVVGDTQNNRPGRNPHDDERRAILARLAEGLRHSVPVVHLGDFVETGARRDQWRRFFDEPFWSALTPAERRLFYAIPGNHEYKTHLLDYGGGDLAPYFEHFPHLQGRRYYFLRAGDASFVFLDAGRNGVARHLGGERWQNGLDEQRRWLVDVVLPQLRRQTQGGRIFLFFHKPAHATPAYVKNRDSAAILALFDALNAEPGGRFEMYAFAGHVHTFSHIVHDYAGDGGAPVEQFTVGTGGGTQRGARYYRRVDRLEDLDLYRQARYRRRVPDDRFDAGLFDRVRRDNAVFGYAEVIAGDRLQVLFHRYDRDAGEFRIDYEYVR